MLRSDLSENQTYAYLRATRTGRWADLAAIPIQIHDLAYPRPGVARNPLSGKAFTVIRAVVLDPDTLQPGVVEGKSYGEYEIPGLEVYPDPRLIRRPWAEHVTLCTTLLAERTDVNRRLEAARLVLARRRDALVALLDPRDVALREWLVSQRPHAASDDPADVRLRLEMNLSTLEQLLASVRRAAVQGLTTGGPRG